MPYSDRLAWFGMWYRQLWAESLGKDGKGTLPVRAVGAVDEHSQVQLYLGGTRDTMFTVLLSVWAGRGRVVPAALQSDTSVPWLAGGAKGCLSYAGGWSPPAALSRPAWLNTIPY